MYSELYSFVFLEAKNSCFVTKNCLKSSYIFVFILSKNSTIDSRKTSLNHEWLVVESWPTPCWITFFCNALSTGVKCLLSFQWNNFDLCLLSEKPSWLISFPKILVGTISWVIFYNFAVFPLVQNKSVLNRKQEKESRSYSLFNTDLACTKGAGYSKVTKYNSRNNYSFRSSK